MFDPVPSRHLSKITRLNNDSDGGFEEPQLLEQHRTVLTLQGSLPVDPTSGRSRTAPPTPLSDPGKD